MRRSKRKNSSCHSLTTSQNAKFDERNNTIHGILNIIFNTHEVYFDVAFRATVDTEIDMGGRERRPTSRKCLWTLSTWLPMRKSSEKAVVTDCQSRNRAARSENSRGVTRPTPARSPRQMFRVPATLLYFCLTQYKQARADDRRPGINDRVLRTESSSIDDRYPGICKLFAFSDYSIDKEIR